MPGAADKGLLVAFDGSFCNGVFFKEVPAGVELVVRCRKDANRTFSTRRYSGPRRGVKWRSCLKGLHYIGCGGINEGECLLR